MSDVFFPQLPFEKKVWVVKLVPALKTKATTYEIFMRSGIVGVFSSEDLAQNFSISMNEKRRDRNFDYLVDEIVWALTT
jgi:hypothetical protein